MKTKVLLFLLFIIAIYKESQSQINLVPNPDFEDYTTCPNDMTQITNATNWTNRGKMWMDPTPGTFFGRMTTPDYFNGCSLTSTGVSVPINISGFQFDHEHLGYKGQGYAGLISFSRGQFAAGGDFFFDDKWTEYIGTVISPMMLGNKYRIQYYAALSDSSVFATSLGLCLSNTVLTSSTTFLKPTISSIFFQNTSAKITLAMDWSQIYYDFTCTDASLTNLTIGNFIDTTYDGIIKFGDEYYPGINEFERAYYFIDDVSLTCTDSMPRNNMPASYTLCNQGFPILDAGAGTLGTIQWYKDGVAIVGATSRYYTPSSIGTYSFVVTSTLIPGLTYTDSTVIYDSPLNTLVSSIQHTDCDTFLNAHILNIQSNLVYTWNVTNVAAGFPSSGVGAFFNTKLNHTAATHLLTLHVTDTKSSCVFDTSFIIYQCCRKINGPPVLINERINDLHFYDIYFAGPYFGSPSCRLCADISIDGVLTIEKNYRFKNTSFYMQPYSRIDITANDTLFLDSCYLTACSDVMWEGIFNGTMEWGNGTLIARNCIIEDAICGITILNGSYTHCIADTFNKNRTDIEIKPFNGSYSPLYVIKSVFWCKDMRLREFINFPDPGDYLGLLIKPFWALKPHECIVANNVRNLEIGTACINCTNYYDNSYVGIHTTNTNLNAYNNYFSNMQPFAPFQGVGILIDKSKKSFPTSRYTATIGSYPITQQNVFVNCRYGIISRNIQSTIQNNYFDNCRTGILIDSGYTPIDMSTILTSVIQDNTINNYTRGIDACFNNRTKIQILRNKLKTSAPNLSNPSSIGIFANQTIYQTNYQIIDNEIVNGRIGISLQNVQRSSVIGNQIRMSSAYTFPIMGISSANTTRTTIANNRVVGNNIAGADRTSVLSNSKAMYFAMSPNDTIYCNYTDTMTWGIEFMGNCISPNNIFGNSMNRHNDQMTLRTSGVIGPQTSRNFRFMTNRLMANEFNPTLYTRSNTCAINSFGGLYDFRTKSITPYRPLVNIAIGVASAINPLIFTTSNYICNPYITSVSGGTGMEIDSSGSNEEKEIAEDIINGTVISEIENEAYQIWLKSELYSNFQQDSIFWADSSEVIQDFITAMQADNIGSFYAVVQNMLNEDITNAQTLNDSIDSNLHIEANEKDIYNILLHLDSTGYSQEILTTLNSMANECPISGGKAVYISRALISSIDLEAIWEDDDRCIQGIDFRRANPNKTDEEINIDKIVIYPNPTKNVLNISTVINSELSNYNIKDIMGKIVMKGKLETKKELYNIDISNLTNGLYIIELYSINNTIKQYKFNVIK